MIRHLIFSAQNADVISKPSPFHVQDQDPLNSDAAKFIVFTVEFAEAIFAKIPTFAKIPFQLIDDILEDKSISQAKAIWPLLEGLAEKLTSENLFPKGILTAEIERYSVHILISAFAQANSPC